MDKQSINGKRRARKLALQALYQWHMSGTEVSEIEAQFHVANNMARVDVPYFSGLLRGVIEHLPNVEANFTPYLDRELSNLNPIELSVLRMGTYEFMCCPETPYKVVLDEAISLSKEFGSQDGHRYVNGVLNKVAKQIRKIEIGMNE